MTNLGNAFSIDVDTRAYTQAMRMLSDEALPRAIASTLNGTADAVKNEAQRNVRRKMIVRSQYTVNSIRQDRTARGRNIRAMFSRVGSISPYLPIQDEGGTIRANDRRIPIPTLQARTSRSIRRAIAGRYRMNAMGAFGRNERYFMGKPKGGNRPVGIWERTNRNKRIRLIRNLEHPSVRIKPTRWYSDALGRYGTDQFINAQYRAAARRELRAIGGTA